MLVFLRKSLILRLCAVVIGLLLIITFCFWWYGRPHRADIALRDITKIAEHIHKTYAGKTNYWGLNSSVLENTEIVKQKQGQFVNTFGKPVLVGQGENGDTVMPGERSFDIVFTDLAIDECIHAASSRFDSSETLGLMQVKIIGKAEQVFEWGAEKYKLPVLSVQAREFCGKNSKIIWTFE